MIYIPLKEVNPLLDAMVSLKVPLWATYIFYITEIRIVIA